MRYDTTMWYVYLVWFGGTVGTVLLKKKREAADVGAVPDLKAPSVPVF